MPDGFRFTGVEELFRLLESASLGVRRAVEAETRRSAREGVAYWRSLTPVDTGRLRRAERAVYIRSRGYIIGARFRVVGPRARVYHLLAARTHPALRNAMQKWVDNIGQPRLIASVLRVLRQHGFQ